jgi:hypothetical protein
MATFHHRITSGRNAIEHIKYIEREGRDSKREDKVYSESRNLPEWSDSNQTFWRAAECGERMNGAVYRGNTIALPAELTVDQNVELAKVLCQQLFPNKTYTMAVHYAVGKVSGLLNPHMHTMSSDRLHDAHKRPPERWFARFNPRCPEQGGCRKDSGGKTPFEMKNELTSMRKTIAGTINEALARHGHASRVDHRSLRDQGMAREAERHLGPARIKAMSAEERSEFSRQRGSTDLGTTDTPM